MHSILLSFIFGYISNFSDFSLTVNLKWDFPSFSYDGLCFLHLWFPFKSYIAIKANFSLCRKVDGSCKPAVKI